MFDIFGILYSPGEFIRKKLAAPLAFKMPFIIVLLAALTGLLENLIASDRWFARLMEQMPSDLTGLEDGLKLVKLGSVLSAVFGTLDPLLTWVIGTGILSCLGILVEGEGEYRKLLQLTAYPYLVMALFGVVGILFAITYQPRFTMNLPETAVIAKHPDVLKDASRDAIQGEMMATNFRYLLFLGWGFKAWMVVLQFMTFKLASKLSDVKAGVCVGGVVAIYVVTQMIRSLFALGGI